MLFHVKCTNIVKSYCYKVTQWYNRQLNEVIFCILNQYNGEVEQVYNYTIK